MGEARWRLELMEDLRIESIQKVPEWYSNTQDEYTRHMTTPVSVHTKSKKKRKHQKLKTSLLRDGLV